MASRIIYYAEEGNMEGLRECLPHLDVDYTNKNGDTALHIACRKGHKDCVRLLVAAGACMDKKNASGQTPLHIAVLSKYNNIALLLLQSGANVDSRDDAGDRPIHLASKEGYVDLTQTLCAFGSSLDKPNNLGLLPLHLASRNGHIEVVRCLCLSGCNIEQANNNGIKAEIMAFKNNHQDIGYLLNKLRISYLREAYIDQLMATEKPIPKLSVKFLGSSGVGKTTLVQSLKAGYFISLFSRSKSQSFGSITGKSSPSSPTETHIEMDVTARQPVTSESPHYQYTRGIELHQATLSSGDITLWDFSGLDTYYIVYDFFMGDSYSYYVIVFNLCDTSGVQYYQCSFWLTFLQIRLHSSDVMNKICPRVILVGTHADASRIHRDVQGNFLSSSVEEMRDRLAEEFPDLLFDSKVILCDAHLPNSPGIRDLKFAVAKAKLNNSQSLNVPPAEKVGETFEKKNNCSTRRNIGFKCTGFLTNTMQYLQTLRKEYEVFPVISWNEFVDKVHRNINPLAGSDHFAEVVQQLGIMGEILYLKSNTEDIIILNMSWLCGELIGGLLSLESIARARLTGCYTEDDFQGCFPYGPADKILALLGALQICIQCDNDGEMEYEFPCYNLVEKLEGLWSAVDERYSPPSSCYGGIRLKAPFRLLQNAFPRLQVNLRRATNICQDPDVDLYQWFRGSKLCSGHIESLITLEDDGQVIDIKIRGTEALKLSCFYFLEDILGIIQQVLLTMFPGIVCERHVLSSEELRLHVEEPYCWPPEHVLSAILSSSNLNTSLRNPNICQEEPVLQLIGFGSEKVPHHIIPGGELSIENVPVFCQRALARLLDPVDPLGRDWCLLAVKLGLSQKIAVIDNTSHVSKTLLLLELWRKSKEANVGNLIKKLVDIGREDAANILMRSTPFYKVVTPNYEEPHEKVRYLLT